MVLHIALFKCIELFGNDTPTIEPAPTCELLSPGSIVDGGPSDGAVSVSDGSYPGGGRSSGDASEISI